MSRTYMVLMNWYSHYGEVCDKPRKHIANISDLSRERRSTADLEQIQNYDAQIQMEQSKIYELQTKDNPWFQEAWHAHEEACRLTKRASNLLHRAEE